MLRVAVLLLIAAGLGIGGRLLWEYHPPAAPVEIYQGITYGCERVPTTDESAGLVHWVRADLKVPGVQIYITPMDPGARSQGFEYKLKYTSTAVADEHLAAAVNGTLFGSDSGYIRLPGDDAFSNETAVADHVVNHVDKDCYLLWWDDNLLAHLETTKPPTEPDLHHARWGIAGQQATLFDGKVGMWAGKLADKRTIIAADPKNRLVWIACFDWASYHFAAMRLQSMGAKIGTLVDGGTSVAMAIGDQAKNVRPGVVTGNWRPVATVFGFRAKPLP
jgi:hypothetical protein